MLLVKMEKYIGFCVCWSYLLWPLVTVSYWALKRAKKEEKTQDSCIFASTVLQLTTKYGSWLLTPHSNSKSYACVTETPIYSTRGYSTTHS